MEKKLSYWKRTGLTPWRKYSGNPEWLARTKLYQKKQRERTQLNEEQRLKRNAKERERKRIKREKIKEEYAKTGLTKYAIEKLKRGHTPEQEREYNRARYQRTLDGSIVGFRKGRIGLDELDRRLRKAFVRSDEIRKTLGSK